MLTTSLGLQGFPIHPESLRALRSREAASMHEDSTYLLPPPLWPSLLSSSSSFLSPKIPHSSHLASAKVQRKHPRLPIGSTSKGRDRGPTIVTVTATQETTYPPRLDYEQKHRRNNKEGTQIGYPVQLRKACRGFPAQKKSQGSALRSCFSSYCLITMNETQQTTETKYSNNSLFTFPPKLCSWMWGRS